MRLREDCMTNLRHWLA